MDGPVKRTALTTLLELGGSVLAITPNQEKGATENE